MNCLVTGGAGFIGSHLVDRLIELGHRVWVIDNLSTGKRENVNKEAQLFVGPLEETDLLGLMNAWRIEYVFHLAALPRIQRSIDAPQETHLANVTATLILLDACRKVDTMRLIIYSSSSSVYGKAGEIEKKEDGDLQPHSPYAAQKLMGEMYCGQFSYHYKLKTIVLRYFNVYGPRMSNEGAYKLVFSIFLDQLRQGQKLTVFGDGSQTRDFTHVSDVVEANIKAAFGATGPRPRIYNIGTGTETSVKDLALMIMQGREDLIEYIQPNPRGDWEEQRKRADIQRAKIYLEWEAKVNIHEGIESLLEAK